MNRAEPDEGKASSLGAFLTLFKRNYFAKFLRNQLLIMLCPDKGVRLSKEVQGMAHETPDFRVKIFIQSRGSCHQVQQITGFGIDY